MPRVKGRRSKVESGLRPVRFTEWVVYMVRCGDGSLYTGCTNDLLRRIARHRAGKGAAYTRSRLPLRVVYRESVSDKSAALKREYAIKQLSRAEKLKLIRRPRQRSLRR